MKDHHLSSVSLACFGLMRVILYGFVCCLRHSTKGPKQQFQHNNPSQGAPQSGAMQTPLGMMDPVQSQLLAILCSCTLVLSFNGARPTGI